MKRRILRRTVGVAVLLIGIATVVWWSWVSAQWRAVVVLAHATEQPVASRVTAALTREPSLNTQTFNDTPTTVVRPHGSGPWPTVVFITGVDKLGRSNARVVNTARGLARAGFIVYVPELKGLAGGSISGSIVDETVQFSRAVADRTTTADGQITLISVSMGASLALLAASDARLAHTVKVVVGIAPFADVKNVIRIATTGHYEDSRGKLHPYPVNPKLMRIVVRSALRAARTTHVPPHVLDKLSADVAASSDPLQPLRVMGTGPLPVPGDLQSILKLLLDTSPRNFDANYAALPNGVERNLSAVSPIEHASEITASVYLASGTRDAYFPVEESRRIAAAVSDGNLTVTDALDHAVPTTQSFKELLILDGFAVAALREAAK